MASIDWSRPLCTQHETPHIGYLQPDCPTTGRKRVLQLSPSNPAAMPTVFRYDADGRTRGDGAPSPHDLLNYEPDDGQTRLGLDGKMIACDGRAAA